MSALDDTQPMSLIDIADAMTRGRLDRPDAMIPDLVAEQSTAAQLVALP